MGRVEKLARKLIEDQKVRKPPIPIESIARNLDIKLQFEPFEGKDDISGMLFRNDDHTIIGVNSAHASTRQRFTIAHEIGHLLLHRGKLFVDTSVKFRDAKSSLATDRGEIEANAFAAELLMPSDMIHLEVQKKLGKNPTHSMQSLIEEMSESFGVSQQAMEYRLANLGILSLG
ncbi:MAG: ImmA/IrrE family metallo-endopeptidase [Nitrospirae bacterium]|nr:MAG: ImmA/IrrE family metallo-endopeptidase [Nitrospirota bacterium]